MQLKHSVAVIVVLAALLVLVPGASAAPDNFFVFANPSAVNCALGYVEVDWTYSFLANSLVRETVTFAFPPAPSITNAYENIIPADERLSERRPVPVPMIGYIEYTIEVYNPDGSLASRSTIFAECPSGVVTITTIDNIPGILPPDPSQRVQADVLVTTPVYALPDPGTALDDTLLAGQQWFVVAEVTGTDGELWYEVFVGGTNNAYVPTYTLSLPGPIPQ
ncbi:MAG: hypothetical protein GYB65_02790 [Chloroflexi bacterium]|nr:hypothetical protein [Chloroflexota bacterium]